MANSFGSYTYSASFIVLESHPEQRTTKLRSGDRLGEHGGYSGGGLQAPSRLTLEGVVFTPHIGTPNIRELWRGFEAAHKPGAPQQLKLDYFGERFIWAEVESVAEVHASPPLIGARQFEANFYCVDPCWYENQEQGPQSLSVGASTNINNGGSRYAAPTINIVVTHPGTISITSDAGTMELYCNLTGTFSVDSYQRFVTRNTANYWYRWDGVFPSLEPGATTVALGVTWGSIASASIRWHNRD